MNKIFHFDILTNIKECFQNLNKKEYSHLIDLLDGKSKILDKI